MDEVMFKAGLGWLLLNWFCFETRCLLPASFTALTSLLRSPSREVLPVPFRPSSACTGSWLPNFSTSPSFEAFPGLPLALLASRDSDLRRPEDTYRHDLGEVASGLVFWCLVLEGTLW